MPKKEETGSPINFEALNPEQEKIVIHNVKLVAEYLGEMATVRESMKETLDGAMDLLDADKASAKAGKKLIRNLARAYIKRNGEELKAEHDAFGILLEKIGA